MSCPAAPECGPPWPIPGHARVDQFWIGARQRRGSEPKALHDARSIALDEHVGAARRAFRRRAVLLVLEIEHDRWPSALQHGIWSSAGDAAWSINAYNIGAHVRQQHGAERPRTYACKLKHTNTREWSGTHAPPAPVTLLVRRAPVRCRGPRSGPWPQNTVTRF